MRSPDSYSPDSDTDSDAHTREDWPVTKEAMNTARAFLRDCAAANQPTLLLPDKDADGLCAGHILRTTLIALGLAPTLIHAHFVAKGSNVHAPAERERITALTPRPAFVVVADQGSRPGPPILSDAREELESGEGDCGVVRTLIVDHHLSSGFPTGALVLSAAAHSPVATSATLAYLLCAPLVRGSCASAETTERLEWLCVLGTMGDLGASHKWEEPWPDMRDCAKRWTKKVLGEAVALVNAPRRTARYDVHTAWAALLSSDPAQIVAPTSKSGDTAHIQRLHDARREIRVETERCGHTAPAFSGDGRVALVRISSEAQVHPLIATRWASTLKGSRLQIVICANSGYLPGAGMTNFACRIARCALPRIAPRTRGPRMSSERAKARQAPSAEPGEAICIPDVLREYASRVPGLTERMGDDFARGHAQASGGIVKSEDFEALWGVMQDSASPERSGPPRKKRRTEMVQKNTLKGWLNK